MRKEIVLVDGFSFGKTTASALPQSIYSVESCVAQNARSSSSLSKFGVSLNSGNIFPRFSFVHITGRDNPYQIVFDGKSNE